jgi:hypothetical protein
MARLARTVLAASCLDVVIEHYSICLTLHAQSYPFQNLIEPATSPHFARYAQLHIRDFFSPQDTQFLQPVCNIPTTRIGEHYQQISSQHCCHYCYLRPRFQNSASLPLFVFSLGYRHSKNFEAIRSILFAILESDSSLLPGALGAAIL